MYKQLAHMQVKSEKKNLFIPKVIINDKYGMTTDR